MDYLGHGRLFEATCIKAFKRRLNEHGFRIIKQKKYAITSDNGVLTEAHVSLFTIDGLQEALTYDEFQSLCKERNRESEGLKRQSESEGLRRHRRTAEEDLSQSHPFSISVASVNLAKDGISQKRHRRSAEDDLSQSHPFSISVASVNLEKDGSSLTPPFTLGSVDSAASTVAPLVHQVVDAVEHGRSMGIHVLTPLSMVGVRGVDDST